jgi:hypothetical protein
MRKQLAPCCRSCAHTIRPVAAPIGLSPAAETSASAGAVQARSRRRCEQLSVLCVGAHASVRGNRHACHHVRVSSRILVHVPVSPQRAREHPACMMWRMQMRVRRRRCRSRRRRRSWCRRRRRRRSRPACANSLLHVAAHVRTPFGQSQRRSASVPPRKPPPAPAPSQRGPGADVSSSVYCASAPMHLCVGIGMRAIM